jgi:hypothetical protein
MSGRGLEEGLFGPLANVPIYDNTRNSTRQSEALSGEDRETIQIILNFGNGWITVQTPAGDVKREGGTISWRYHNPGNLKWGDFAASQGAIGAGWGGHAVFPNYASGMNAKGNLLFSPTSPYYNLTLLQAMNRYAPANDKGKGVPKGGNQPNVYANYISNTAKISIHQRLSDLEPNERLSMIYAMNTFEGFKPGSISLI